MRTLVQGADALGECGRSRDKEGGVRSLLKEYGHSGEEGAVAFWVRVRTPLWVRSPKRSAVAPVGK